MSHRARVGRSSSRSVGSWRPGHPAATARILAAVSDVADVTWIGQAPHDEDEPLRSLGVPITGWLDHGEAVARLARASVMVHWSAGDGASLAVLEAMAVGTAVVASDIPANRELLGDAQVVSTQAEAIARSGACSSTRAGPRRAWSSSNAAAPPPAART